MKNLVKKIANILNLKELGKRALTVIILTLTAIITVWVYASFVEPAVGPNDAGWDQDFLQNILGADNNNNDFSSSNVAANATGSIIEREQYIQTGIGTYADATTTPAAAASVFAALKGLDYSGYQEYTSGSGNWVVPNGVKYVDVLLVSGGGGGGGAKRTTTGGAGGGGGGGGAIGVFTDVRVTPGATIAYAVGAGGTAGASTPTAGGTGGTSSFVGSHIRIQLTGGLGGSAGNDAYGAGGAGAACYSVSGGAANTDGSFVSSGTSSFGLHSGGGGATGLTAYAGFTIYASTPMTGSGYGGCGGASYGAGADRAVTNDDAGISASANTGGGGSGGSRWNVGQSAGGAGGSGYILITW